MQGYAVNEKRLAQKQQEVRHLKDGIRILSRAIEDRAADTDFQWLNLYAAALLCLIVKNHAFVDGNKRIAAACFLLFLDKNNRLRPDPERLTISNEALAGLTLFVAVSRPDEMEIVKRLIISILNINKP